MRNRSVVFVACVALVVVGMSLTGCQWMRSVVGMPVADPALKGSWSFDEGSGTVAASDVCKKTAAVPATLKWVDGKEGKAVEFNGTDYVVIKACPCMNSPQYTLSAWTKLKKTGDYHYIAWKAGPIFPEDKDARRFDLWVQMDGMVSGIMHTADGAEANQVQGTTDITDDKWHHVALTYDCKVITLYVDGKKESELTPTGPLAKNDHDLWIGGRPEGVVATGAIDEVKFYNRALTAAEIATQAGAE